MSVSLKCQYGLRALFELSLRYGDGLVRIPEIAQAQAIPLRFLEAILNQLRQGGFVESRRGKGGGFTLAKAPAAVSVADIVSFIDGEIYSIDCEGNTAHKCRFTGNCVFMPLWQQARAALEAVYGSCSLQDLVDASKQPSQLEYHI